MSLFERYLSVWVFLCIVVGIALGQAMPAPFQAIAAMEVAQVNLPVGLLIFADDVQCAHGNTIGALDDDALFYARQRGIPDDQARALLTGAFVGEVIDRIEHDGARAVAQAWVDARLGAV